MKATFPSQTPNFPPQHSPTSHRHPSLERYVLAPNLYKTNNCFSQLSFPTSSKTPRRQSTKSQEETEPCHTVSRNRTKVAMPLSRADVQYVLTQFDAGVQPHRILIGLQYRAFPPGENLATIERCLRENGRRQYNHQTGNAAQGNQSSGIGRRASNPPRPANQGAPGSSATTQEARQFPANPTSETNDLVNPRPTLDWDAEADGLAISAHRSGQSVDEILLMLRSRGYDITEGEVALSLLRQGVPVAR